MGAKKMTLHGPREGKTAGKGYKFEGNFDSSTGETYSSEFAEGYCLCPGLRLLSSVPETPPHNHS
jgi:hypothetical protein